MKYQYGYVYSTFFTGLYFHFNNVLSLYLRTYKLKLKLTLWLKYLFYSQSKHLEKSPCCDYFPKSFFKNREKNPSYAPNEPFT